MKKKEDNPLKQSSLEKDFLKNEKPSIKFHIPVRLRTSLIWIVFFAILGIIVQSIQRGEFVFFSFFGSNYVDWFRSFGSFSSRIAYTSASNLLLSIFRQWYYFFYTGGLISFIWELVVSLMNSEFKVAEISLKKKPKQADNKDITIEESSVKKK